MDPVLKAFIKANKLSKEETVRFTCKGRKYLARKGHWSPIIEIGPVTLLDRLVALLKGRKLS